MSRRRLPPETASRLARGATPRAVLTAALCVVALAASATPASAHWSTVGGGAGAGATATMPAASAPTGSAIAQSVTIAWTQSLFFGVRLGSYPGGGYVLKRYPSGATTPTVPNGSCSVRISGAATALQCVEADVPYGSWRYSVTPVLYTFTGGESAMSAIVAVATSAPTLSSATAQNPASGQPTGAIQANWSAVAGATGYNLYRRTAGAFDYTTPLNGATPITATSYTDPGSGLSGATTYRYVVRALAGSPAAESDSSAEQTATAVARPAPPAGVTGTAVPAARVDVAWSSVAQAIGYNVYRRAAPASYNFSAPLNGGTPVAPTTYLDTTSVHATSYRYAVRAVIAGAGGIQVESLDGNESAPVSADGVPPPVPTATSVTSGGPTWGSTCGVTAGTRYVNSAGQASVGVSATIPIPEVGESVVFSATSPGSTPAASTVAAGGTSVSTSLNLTSFVAGTVTLTARTSDAVGNLSATVGPSNPIIKDVTAPALTAVYSGGTLGLSPEIKGMSECGATVVTTKTAGGNTGATWQTTIASGTSYSIGVEGPLLGLGSVTYSTVSTDRAGNTGGVVVASG